MTCNCIKEIPIKLIEHSNRLRDYDKTPVISAEFKDLTYPIRDGQLKVALKTDIKLTCENRKTPKTTLIIFTYCPFCGEQYDK